MEQRVRDLETRMVRFETHQNELHSKLVESKEAIFILNSNVNLIKSDMDKLSQNQKIFHEKMNDFMLSLPNSLESATCRIIKTIDEKMDIKFTLCRATQNELNNKNYLPVPPGFFGNILRLVVIAIAGYGGWDIIKIFTK